MFSAQVPYRRKRGADNSPNSSPLLILGCGHKGGCRKWHPASVAITIDRDARREPTIVGDISKPMTLHQLSGMRFQAIVFECLPNYHTLSFPNLIQQYEEFLDEKGVFIISGNFINEYFQATDRYHLFVTRTASDIALLSRQPLTDLQAFINTRTGSPVTRYLNSLFTQRQVDDSELVELAVSESLRTIISKYTQLFKQISNDSSRAELRRLCITWSLTMRLQMFEELIGFKNADDVKLGQQLTALGNRLSAQAALLPTDVSSDFRRTVAAVIEAIAGTTFNYDLAYLPIIELTAGRQLEINIDHATKYLPDLPKLLALLISEDPYLKKQAKRDALIDMGFFNARSSASEQDTALELAQQLADSLCLVQ